MACLQATSMGNMEQGKQIIAEKITKARFLKYFDMYCSMRAKTDERWRNVPSPYDVLPAALLGMEEVRSASVPLLPGIAGTRVFVGKGWSCISVVIGNVEQGSSSEGLRNSYILCTWSMAGCRLPIA